MLAVLALPWSLFGSSAKTLLFDWCKCTLTQAKIEIMAEYSTVWFFQASHEAAPETKCFSNEEILLQNTSECSLVQFSQHSLPSHMQHKLFQIMHAIPHSFLKSGYTKKNPYNGSIRLKCYTHYTNIFCTRFHFIISSTVQVDITGFSSWSTQVESAKMTNHQKLSNAIEYKYKILYL